MEEKDILDEYILKKEYNKPYSKILKLEKSRGFSSYRQKSLSYKSPHSREWKRRNLEYSSRKERHELKNNLCHLAKDFSEPEDLDGREMIVVETKKYNELQSGPYEEIVLSRKFHLHPTKVTNIQNEIEFEKTHPNISENETEENQEEKYKDYLMDDYKKYFILQNELDTKKSLKCNTHPYYENFDSDSVFIKPYAYLIIKDEYSGFLHIDNFDKKLKTIYFSIDKNKIKCKLNKIQSKFNQSNNTSFAIRMYETKFLTEKEKINKDTILIIGSHYNFCF